MTNCEVRIAKCEVRMANFELRMPNEWLPLERLTRLRQSRTAAQYVALRHSNFVRRHLPTAAIASPKVNRFSYNALPTITPSLPTAPRPRKARNSSSEATPPDAITFI